MSFILEAIRRSEEARHKRLIPDVSTIHTALPAPARAASSRTVQAALAMGIALALVVAAGFALGPWLRQLREAEPPAPVAAAAPAAERDVPAASEPAPALGELAPAAASSAPAAAPAPAPVPAAPRQPPPANRRRRSRRAGPIHRPQASRPEKPRREPKPVAPSARTQSEQGIGQAAREAAPPSPEASELVAATALRDLPPSVQRTLPSIAITLHRYAAGADARMIRVNGRVAHEGDAIGGELSVAEITRNGVVFAIGGQRFYMDAFQTWQAKSGS